MELSSYRSSKRRYSILRILRIMLQVVGALVMVGGLLAAGLAFIMLATSSGGYQSRESPIMLIAGLGYGIFGSAYCFALAEGIQLAIHVEENTRTTAQLLAELVDRLAPPSPRNRRDLEESDPRDYRRRDD